jgi:hypothetical protein
VVRQILTIIYVASSVMLLAGCPEGSGLSGDRDASISLKPATKVFTISKEEPKKLQMVIIADPTGSMVETQRDLTKYFPSFTQELLNTGFVFEVFCSTTSYTGTTFGEIISIKSKDTTSTAQLQQALSACINTKLTDLDVGDERGLEAAKQTWSQIIKNGLLDPTAVKLTMIVSNEDDCSRDLGKFPSDDNISNRCVDQNVLKGSTAKGIKGGKFPITDTGYGEDPKPILDFPGFFDHPTLFSPKRYIDFFNKELNYVAGSKSDALDQVLRQRGHIFAPVIMQPPAAIGKDAAYQCSSIKAKRAAAIKASPVMSFGMRYFQVAEGSGNETYSLCDELEKVFQEINITVQNEVEIKRFVLNRKPKNPSDLKIEIARLISDVDKAKVILDRMDVENSRSSAASAWKANGETQKTVGSVKVKSQKWLRTLTIGNGFTYNEKTNEVIFDNKLYEAYNDKLRVMSYEPAMLDGEVNYEGSSN